MRLIDADKIKYFDLNQDMPESNLRVYAVFKETIEQMPAVSEIYGYPISELVTFAQACRRKGISEDNMLEFCLDVSNAYDFAVTEVNRQLQSALRSELEKYERKADAEKEKG